MLTSDTRWLHWSRDALKVGFFASLTIRFEVKVFGFVSKKILDALVFYDWLRAQIFTRACSRVLWLFLLMLAPDRISHIWFHIAMVFFFLTVSLIIPKVFPNLPLGINKFHPSVEIEWILDLWCLLLMEDLLRKKYDDVFYKRLQHLYFLQFGYETQYSSNTNILLASDSTLCKLTAKNVSVYGRLVSDDVINH